MNALPRFSEPYQCGYCGRDELPSELHQEPSISGIVAVWRLGSHCGRWTRDLVEGEA